MSDTSTSLGGPSRSSDAVGQPGDLSTPSSSRRVRSTKAIASFTARSGFPLLATSSYLVQEISQAVSALLESFVSAWAAAVDHAEASNADTSPSPFATFKEVYIQRGWHLHQMHWSEHQETRLGIYHAFVRVLTDSLRPLLPLLSISSEGTVQLDETALGKVPAKEALKAVGVLFALKLIQSTTFATFEVSSSRSTLLIPIEADLYHILALLPSIAKASKAFFGERSGKPGLQPVDDVVYILKDMTGQSQGRDVDSSDGDFSSRESEDAAHMEGSGVFDVLLPTTYEARPALINNRLSIKAEIEKKEGTWGRLRSSEAAQGGFGMSRAGLMRNLVRQRLKLPLRSEDEAESLRPSSHTKLIMDPFKNERRGRLKEDLPVMVPPEKEVEEDLQECRDNLVQQQEAYEGAKRRRIEEADFTSLLPTLQDGTRQTATSGQPADLQYILAAARSSVVHAMRGSMAEQRQNKSSRG